MKTTNLIHILLNCFLLAVFGSIQLNGQSFSQLSQDVKSILKSKSSFKEMIEEVERHYDTLPLGRNERSYKHWARWANNMSYYVGERGELGDVDGLTMQAYVNFKTKSGNRSSAGDWESIGPTQVVHSLGTAIGIGRADRIGFHPTNINIIYVGTSSGGLWKTINGGNTWTPITDALPTTGISGIVVSHDDPDNKVYILTGDGDSSDKGEPGNSGFKNRSTGVYVSYDAGTNWLNLPLPTTQLYYGYSLRQSHSNANVLIAATSAGIYRTNNGGFTWEQTHHELCYDVEFKPGSGTIVYAAMYNIIGENSTFMKSVDGGITWSDIVDFDLPSGMHNIANSERLEIAVTNHNPNAVFLLTGNIHSNTDGCDGSHSIFFKGIYLSNNSGDSFVRTDNGNINLNSNCCAGSDFREQSTYDIALAVNHNNQSVVIAGGIITWRSTDLGFNWAPAYVDDDPNGQCGGTGIEGFIHGDIHQLAYQPISNRLWACTDGGVYYSDNNGLYWHHKCGGLVAGQAYHLGVSNMNSNVVMIGQQDNGIRAKNINSSVWNYVQGADGYDCQYTWGSQTSGFFSVNSSVYEFSSNGISYTQMNTNNSFFKRICSPINNNDILYVGDTNISKFQKFNGIWVLLESFPFSGYHDIERCPSNANRFYFAGGQSYFSPDGSLFRTDNNFEFVEEIVSEIPNRISDVAVKPNNDEEVWYCVGGFDAGFKVLKSNDAGDTWENMTANLPNVPCFSLAIDNNGDAYLGTQLGVFYRSTAMEEWIPFSHKLPKMPVTDIEISQGKIIAATFGRGIWQSDLYSNCIANVSLTNDLTSRQYIEVSNSITATNVIYGGASSDIIYKAGNQINLLPGFHAPAANNLWGHIKVCGDW